MVSINFKTWKKYIYTYNKNTNRLITNKTTVIVTDHTAAADTNEKSRRRYCHTVRVNFMYCYYTCTLCIRTLDVVQLQIFGSFATGRTPRTPRFYREKLSRNIFFSPMFSHTRDTDRVPWLRTRCFECAHVKYYAGRFRTNPLQFITRRHTR